MQRKKLSASSKLIKPTETDSSILFTGKAFNVKRCFLISPQNDKYYRDIIIHNGAVAILAFLNPDEILMIRMYRHAAKEFLWEIPAGVIDPGEKPLQTARRELIEETGYKAGRLRKFFEFFSAPGISEEKLLVYLAWNLEFVGQNLDASEEFELKLSPVKLAKAYELCDKNIIKDAKTLTALYKFRALANSNDFFSK